MLKTTVADRQRFLSLPQVSKLRDLGIEEFKKLEMVTTEYL
jgi:hypothetical protein